MLSHFSNKLVYLYIVYLSTVVDFISCTSNITLIKWQYRRETICSDLKSLIYNVNIFVD